jgi:hypothetical protein
MFRFTRLLLLLGVAAHVSAQGASTIVGRVTSNGKPLAAAAVTIDADVLQNTRITRTTSRGTYWAALLPPGTYRITFAHQGTQTVTRKAEVRLGETVRVDAELQPSEEGESVTMTTITRSILERPQLASSFDSAVVNDLPLIRDLTTRMVLAPGVIGGTVRGSGENLYIVDGAVQQRRGADVEIEEAILDAAVVETTTAAEYGRFSGGVILATSRSGGNELTASLRDTLTSAHWIVGGDNDAASVDDRAEATVGGRIVRDALWFFLAGENGTRATEGRERSGFGKLTASPGSHLTMFASVLRAAIPDESRAAGDATIVISHRAMIAARADTSRVGSQREQHQSLSVHSLVPTPFGDHALVAGGERFHESTSLFAGDTWSDGRWIVSGSARYDDDRGISPRAGAAFDIAGDGHARIAASFARYAGDLDASREEALSWSQRLFTSGYSRVSLVRRIYDSGTTYRALEADVRAEYLVFTFGGAAAVGHPQSSGVAWISGMPPGLEQHVTVSLLERYRSGAATDLSVQYRFTRYRFEPFVKVDVLNVFDRRLTASDDSLGTQRALRIAFGGRL